MDPLGRWIEQFSSEVGRSAKTLDPEGWFYRLNDHDGGGENICGVWIPKFRPVTFIWSPSPRVARIGIEEPRQACHKRIDSVNIFIVPRLV